MRCAGDDQRNNIGPVRKRWATCCIVSMNVTVLHTSSPGHWRTDIISELSLVKNSTTWSDHLRSSDSQSYAGLPSVWHSRGWTSWNIYVTCDAYLQIKEAVLIHAMCCSFAVCTLPGNLDVYIAAVCRLHLTRLDQAAIQQQQRLQLPRKLSATCIHTD